MYVVLQLAPEHSPKMEMRSSIIQLLIKYQPSPMVHDLVGTRIARQESHHLLTLKFSSSIRTKKLRMGIK